MFLNQENKTAEPTTAERDPEIRRMVVEALRNFGEKTFTFEGEHEGPSFLFVGGIHGNEMLGVLVADMLRTALQSGELKLRSGTVRLMLGNTRAIEADKRTNPARPEMDMGRMFTPEVLAHPDAYGWEGRRVQAIADAARVSGVRIDLHGTNNPSPAFVCSASSEAHAAIYRRLTRKAVVIDPQRIITRGERSLDEFSDDCGGVGICYEAGKADDIESLSRVFKELTAVLIERGMIEGELPEPPTPDAPEYEVVAAVPYDPSAEFVFAEGMMQSFAPVAKGQIIGFRAGEPVLSHVDGIILFPKKPEHQASAGAVCYLASPIV